MKKITSKIALTLIGLFICSIAFTQIKFKQKQIDGTNYFAVLESGENKKATLVNEALVLKQLINSNTTIEFRFLSSYVDDLKFTHKKFSIFYDGVEIKGMDFVLHEKEGIIQYINGTYDNITLITTKPTINEFSAVNNAKIFFEASIKTTAASNLSIANKGLCIIKNPLLANAKYALAYKILIDPNSVNGKYIFVNAVNGSIINYENLVCNTNALGTAQTRYSGTQNITTDLQGTQYRLREVRNGVNIKILNANYESNEEVIANTATDFWDFNDNNWTLAEHGVNQVATDAHWAMEKTYDYWLSKHNRNSINNAGMDLTGYVHVGSGYDNAFWSRTRLSMFYGDGSSYFTPLTSIDICAHELGHGICQFTSDLSYASGTESSALNEGFSDIWGASVEAYAAPTKQRWLIGEEITLISPGYLRSMSNPPSGAFAPSSDTYGDANWNNQSDAHYRSGVLNKWYYLLSDGGSGTNGIGNTYNVIGITISKAERIAYRTEQLLNSTANYAMARTMSIQAAQELFGTNSCEEIAVTRAWYAVGVGANYNGTPAAPTISGQNTICPSGVYTISGVGTGANVVWSLSNSYASITVAPGGLSVTVNALTTGPSGVYLIATVTNGCAGVQVTGQKYITIGAPTISGTFTNYFDGSNNPLGFYPGVINPACTGYYIQTNLEIQPGTTVTWSKVSSSNVVNWTQTGNDIKFYLFAANQNVIFELTESNVCGSTTNQFKWQSSNCGGGGGGCKLFAISPNPSKGIVVIGVPNILPPCGSVAFEKNGESLAVKDLLIAQINVYDLAGSVAKKIKVNNAKQSSIDLMNLVNGSYYLEVVCSNGYIEKQLIILQK